MSDLEQAKKLPKYNWPEKLMYVTPESHQIMTKDSVPSADGVESLVTKTDNHSCICRSEAFIRSSATTWYSEIVRVRHEHQSCLEVDPSTMQGFEKYSKDFRSVYAVIKDSCFQYVDVTGVTFLKFQKLKIANIGSMN